MSKNIITTATLDFLNELKENNNRDWFAENKNRYEAVKKEMKSLQGELLDLMSHHDEIEQVKLYRIHRDIRFSPDKTPYKTHLSGYGARATKWRRGGYYFHIEPGGKSIVGGGFWKPEKDDLYRIRQELNAAPDEFRAIINAPNFKKHFGHLEGEQLKTSPRGFDKNSPAVDLLRYKQFLVSKTITDQQVISGKLPQIIDEAFQAMRPFFDYMSEVLTTDENGVPIE